MKTRYKVLLWFLGLFLVIWLQHISQPKQETHSRAWHVIGWLIQEPGDSWLDKAGRWFSK